MRAGPSAGVRECEDVTVDADTADNRLVRVVRGRASEEEVAAVTALLMARATAAAPRGATTPRCTRAGWQRLERSPGFRAPHDWQR